MSFRFKLHVILLFWLCLEVYSAPRKPRLSVADDTYSTYFLRNIKGSPGTYSYGYDISDPVSGNIQFRSEERYSNGTVVGSYGYVDAVGIPHTYRYVADENGYRLFIYIYMSNVLHNYTNSF
ncbi:hypothetical protein O3G_MSEX012698 [Manduca sexta]|uniref:Cuticle protein n=1 Tax=Manduca sexta TaxID=7130 RepID=A0A921ZQF5_MANSE|nr:hypothetical protein O3G_MSEX012698 [Manduca sexta]